MRYFAFLKAINIGGHTVTMERLRKIFADLGYPGAETFIASGNVILEAKGRTSSASREKTIGEGLEEALGYAVPVFLRNGQELRAICDTQPFPAAFMANAVVVNVGLLRDPLNASALKRMREFDSEADRFASSGREFYWASQTKQSESPFFKVKFERTFGTDVTFRNMNTMERLATKYPEAKA